jgi:hypothetical protein
MRLGKKQLARLASMAHVGMAQVVPDAVTNSLVARGLMQPTGTKPGTEDAFIVITAAGFRAIADAIDAGTIAGRPDFDRMRGGDQ